MDHNRSNLMNPYSKNQQNFYEVFCFMGRLFQDVLNKSLRRNRRYVCAASFTVRAGQFQCYRHLPSLFFSCRKFSYKKRIATNQTQTGIPFRMRCFLTYNVQKEQKKTKQSHSDCELKSWQNNFHQFLKVIKKNDGKVEEIDMSLFQKEIDRLI